MEDELSIDLSGIKKFFTGKKDAKSKGKDKQEEKNVESTKEEKALSGKEKHALKKEKVAAKHKKKSEESKATKTTDEEELAIDVSAIRSTIKGMFSGSAESKTEEKGDDDLGVTFDKDAAWNFIKKYHLVLILLIPLFLSAHYRLYSVDLPTMDNHAQANVYNTVRANIANQIAGQYPNLPAAKRNELAEDQFQELLKTQEAQLQANVEQNAALIKERFKDANGQTYLIAIDPYTYYREIENMLENGHVGDEIRIVDGEERSWNLRTAPPVGGPIRAQLHHYVGYYWHKLWSLFDSDVSLLTTFFYVPVLISMLCVIPAFFIARRAGGNVAGFFSSVIVATHPSFLSRTAAGFSDTDPYNVFFPLLITWLFIESIYAKDTKKSLALATAAGLATGLFAFSWPGWWYIFCFLLGTIVLLVCYELFMAKGDMQKGLASLKTKGMPLGLYVVASALFVTLFTSWYAFMHFIYGPLGFIFIQSAAKENLWPNVYTTVAELNAASMTQIISNIGGLLMFSVALLGIAYMLYNAIQTRKTTPTLAFVLSLWFIGTTYAARKGVRFIMLMVPAYAVAFGIGIYALYYFFTQVLSDMFEIKKAYLAPVVFICLLLFLAQPIQSARATGINAVPSMTDVWWNALEGIKANSAEDAVITSWWDFGHWFKAVSDRAVTFDGASQNTPQAHWVGKLLLSDSEAQSIGILRMLNCGANTAFDTLQEMNGEDSIKSVETLYAIFELDYAGAQAELSARGYDAARVLPHTHCTPPEGYLITSEDMVSKSGVWGHFGIWNFTRSKIVVDTKGKGYAEAIESVQALGFDEETAVGLYNELQGKTTDRAVNDWIAPWPGYAPVQGRYVAGCRTQGDGILCDNNLGVNFTNMEARFTTPQGLAAPAKLVYVDGEDIAVKEYVNGTQGTSAVLIPQGDSYQSMYLSDEQAAGLFTRLFFLEGHGLKHFERTFDQRTINGWRVIVWKIDWEGNSLIDAYGAVPVEAVATEAATTET